RPIDSPHRRSSLHPLSTSLLCSSGRSLRLSPHRGATLTWPCAPESERNARDEFVPDGTHARLAGHDHSAADGKSEEQGQSQRGHLYPEGLHIVVLRRGETHELKDAGRQKDHETYQQPPFAVSRDLRQRLVPHAKP